MKQLVFLLLIFCVLFLYSEDIQLNYSIMDELYPNENFSMVLFIDKGVESIENVYLVIAIENSMSEKKFKMELKENTTNIIVDREELFNEPFYYYFEIEKKDGTIQYYPENPIQRMSNTVKFLEQNEEENLSVLILSPDDLNSANKNDFLLTIYINKELKNRKIIIDNKDITDLCTLGKNIISYVPDKITEGEHKIDIYADNMLIKSFRIIIGESRNFPDILNGKIGMNFRMHNYSGDTILFSGMNNDKFDENVYINLFGKASFLSYDLLLQLYDNEFNSEQSINRYRLKISIPHLSITGIDYYLKWNKIALWNIHSRGVLGELSVKPLYIAYALGEIYNAVEGEYEVINSDTIINKYGTYKRNMNAVNLGFNFSNFKTGLAFSEINDNANSIIYGVNPKNNFIGGYYANLLLFKNRLNIRFDIAGSGLTNDITLEDTNEDFPFKYNLSTYPINPVHSLSYIVDAKFFLNYFKFNIYYKEIAPYFYSLALPICQNDYRNIGGNVFIPIYRNTLLLNLNFSYKTNDIDNLTYYDFDNYFYSINLMFNNINIPSINISFSDNINNIVATDSSESSNTLYSFKVNLKHNKLIPLFKSGFSIYYSQSVFTADSALGDYMSTSMGINGYLVPLSFIKFSLNPSINVMNNDDYNTFAFSINSRTIFFPNNSIINPSLSIAYTHKTQSDKYHILTLSYIDAIINNIAFEVNFPIKYNSYSFYLNLGDKFYFEEEISWNPTSLSESINNLNYNNFYLTAGISKTF